MKEGLVLSAGIVGLAGLFRGVALCAVPEIAVLQNTIVAVLTPLCAPLSLYLGIEAWKRKRGVWGYATLLATSGIAGAALGPALMVWVLD